MRWLRFSIAGFMAFIVYAAIGLTAAANVDDPWYGRVFDDAYFMVTIFLLASATILAVIRRGRAQAIWLGFAIFGWVHVNFGWPDSGGAPQRARIVTRARVDGTYRPRFPHTTIASWTMQDNLSDGSNPLKLDYAWHVLQSTLTMATAVVGAFVGNLLWVRGQRAERRARDALASGATPLRE
jgi:hypothetical protein